MSEFVAAEGSITTYRFDHGECVIEVTHSGRIAFYPKDNEEMKTFQDMTMPGRDFWEGLSAMLHNLYVVTSDLRRDLAIKKTEVLVADKPKKTFIVGNKKAVFMAGFVAGQRKNITT